MHRSLAVIISGLFPGGEFQGPKMCSKWALSTKELPFDTRQLPLLHQLSYVLERGELRHPGL